MLEMFVVPRVLRTREMLQRLAKNSNKSLNIMSYYWELLFFPRTQLPKTMAIPNNNWINLELLLVKLFMTP